MNAEGTFTGHPSPKQCGRQPPLLALTAPTQDCLPYIKQAPAGAIRPTIRREAYRWSTGLSYYDAVPVKLKRGSNLPVPASFGNHNPDLAFVCGPF